MASIRVTRALTRSSHILCSNKDPQLKKLANSTTRFLLGFSVSGFPLDVGAVRSRRWRHSSPLGLMWGREDGSVETLDEPHVGNEACPRTSSNPDAVVLGPLV
jgi:hypothetical protein